MEHSLLGQLPREIRDQVYRETLFDANGLLFQPRTDEFGSLIQRVRPGRSLIITWLAHRSLWKKLQNRRCYRREHNQLKYTCKQLYYETQNLCVKYNVLFFINCEGKTALRTCLDVLLRCDHLRSIVIQCSAETFRSSYSKSEFSALIAYCNSHIQTVATLYIPYWSQTAKSFVLIGLHFLAEFRGLAAFEQAQQCLYGNSQTLAYISSEQHGRMPRNLRCHPAEEVFDQDVFMQNLYSTPIFITPSTLKLVRSWFEQGL